MGTTCFILNFDVWGTKELHLVNFLSNLWTWLSLIFIKKNFNFLPNFNRVVVFSRIFQYFGIMFFSTVTLLFLTMIIILSSSWLPVIDARNTTRQKTVGWQYSAWRCPHSLSNFLIEIFIEGTRQLIYNIYINWSKFCNIFTNSRLITKTKTEH